MPSINARLCTSLIAALASAGLVACAGDAETDAPATSNSTEPATVEQPIPENEATADDPDPSALPYNPGGVELASLGAPEFTGTIEPQWITPTADASGQKVVYLTFDDGPDPTYTPDILDMLDRYDAKATFFLLGNNAERHPDLVEEIKLRGHAIGSHSYDHPNLAKLGTEELAEQMSRTDAAIGARTSCMRPPYGSTNQRTRAELLAMDKWILHWDLGSGDWEGRGVDLIASTLVTGAHNGALTLMHDGGGRRDATRPGTEKAIIELTAQGYTFPVLPMCQLFELNS